MDRYTDIHTDTYINCPVIYSGKIEHYCSKLFGRPDMGFTPSPLDRCVNRHLYIPIYIWIYLYLCIYVYIDIYKYTYIYARSFGEFLAKTFGSKEGRERLGSAE